MPTPQPTPFGQRLRHWRRLRSLSQLDLAVRSEVSSRHISFMETGRSRPSSRMVLRLCETLDVPLRERNDLLIAAGCAPAYRERTLDAPEMAAVRRVVDHMLRQHDPYPAFVLDRWWDLVDLNEPARMMFPVPADGPVNLVEHFLAPGPFRDMVENWSEVAWITVHRLRREVASAGPDPKLRSLLARAEALVADVPQPGPELNLDSPVLPSRVRVGDQVISTISTIASFNGARDVTLDELRIELVFPADDGAEGFFQALAAMRGQSS